MRVTLIFLLLLSIILAIRYFFFFKNQPKYNVGENVILEGVLLDEPRRLGNTQRFYIQRIQVNTKSNIDLHYGDRVQINGLIEQQKTQSKGTVQEILFGTKRYLVKQSTVKRAEVSNGLFVFSYLIRERVSRVFASYLSPNHSALLLGIVLGVRQE